MKRSRHRLPFGLSAGRATALALGVCAPIAIWAGLNFMSADSAAAKAPGVNPRSSSGSVVAEVLAAPDGQTPRTTGLQRVLDAPTDGSPEGRLIEVYRLIGTGQTDVALNRAESLVRDVPNFQLAQLTYGDLLLARTAPLQSVGAGAEKNAAAAERLAQLREEAQRRITALQERPPAGALPAQFLDIPPSVKHAIAVDASRSRLYLFENGPKGLQLVADHYASIGKFGPDKSVEGDQRTPIGVYYITSRLNPEKLTDFYGAGALPLNYPNEHDRRMGRTGSGIWLHGVPSENYARTPLSTDGCVALANPELKAIMDRVQPRTTPVVIARSLDWITPEALEEERRQVRNLLEGWRVARGSGDINRLMAFYSPQFASGSRDIRQWRQALERESSTQRGRELDIKDLSILGWTDQNDVLVVTFGEVAQGQRTGVVKRQYWSKEDGLWKIFFEGVIG